MTGYIELGGHWSMAACGSLCLVVKLDCQTTSCRHSVKVRVVPSFVPGTVGLSDAGNSPGSRCEQCLYHVGIQWTAQTHCSSFHLPLVGTMRGLCSRVDGNGQTPTRRDAEASVHGPESSALQTDRAVLLAAGLLHIKCKHLHAKCQTLGRVSGSAAVWPVVTGVTQSLVVGGAWALLVFGVREAASVSVNRARSLSNTDLYCDAVLVGDKLW